MANERLILIDGSAMIFRAYYAIPGDLRTREGLPTNAIFGFTNMFTKLLAGKTPDWGAVVFDAPGPTFRSERYAEYKAQRPKMADDLAVQLPWIDKVVEAFRFPSLRLAGYEADDVIGTLTRQGLERGLDVVIVSADKDFAQLIGPHVKMLDTLRDISYDTELVRTKWGVSPERFIDYLALLGDKVDNIPGVPGVGQKTAATLLERYHNLEGIYEHIEQLKGRAKKNLEKHKDQALFWELATIDCQAPLEKSLDDLAYTPPTQEVLNELFRELEFFSLLGASAKDAQALEEAGETDYLLLERPEALETALKGVTQAALQAIHDEPSAVRGQWVGLAVSPEAGKALYAPVNEATAPVIRDYLQDPSRQKVFHDAKAMMVLTRRRGWKLTGVAGDTRLAAFLVDPSRTIPHDLGRVVKEYLHRVLRPVKELVGGGKGKRQFSQLDPQSLSAYACHLADVVGQLWPILKERVDLLQLFERDLPLSGVLADMELAGILVDQADLAALGAEFRTQLEVLREAIYGLAGRTFNIGSTKQLATVLFDEMQLPVIKRTKTGYSTNAEVLQRLAPKHEIARHLLKYRQLEKLINTYTDVLAREVHPETGRIHTTFQQTTGATGRLITTDPDLQRTPVKTPQGRRIRQAFITEPGWTLVAADWSQIELRILAHVSRDTALVEAFNTGKDIHRRTASELFDCSVDEVTKPQREIAKTVNFATIYGQGATALGQILSVSRKEAQSYIERYFKAYSGVRTWLDKTIEQALMDGYVETLIGRRRHIPELFSKNFMDRQAGERIAANTPIQGTAADICKTAMLDIAAELADYETRMLLQIHDELIFECPTFEVEAVKELVKRHMEHGVELAVPLVAEIGTGPSLGSRQSLSS